jgi:hypothetical protein
MDSITIVIIFIYLSLGFCISMCGLPQITRKQFLLLTILYPLAFVNSEVKNWILTR